MPHSHAPAGGASQRGAALLVFMLLFFLAATTWILAQGNAGSSRTRADKATSAALALAREALIGRAASDGKRPGSLPCPDANDDGVAEFNCQVSVGRLPWKTLGLPALVDGNGDRLWYAVSPELRDDNSAKPITAKTALQLHLDGAPNVAAIIFSPGAPLATQNGRPSYNVADYLDGSNSDGDTAYISGPASQTFNDKVLTISHDDLFRIVNRRILGTLAGVDGNTGLGYYYNANGSKYPPPASDLSGLDFHFDTGTANLLTKNGWYSLISYGADTTQQQATLAIAAAPGTTCTITPGKMTCTSP